MATASRCINHPEKVHPELRERVDKAFKELAYVINGRARALATSRSHNIGAIVPTLNNSIFAAAAEVMQERLGEAGYTLMLACSGYDAAKELETVRAFLSRGIDGMILVGEDHDPEVFALLEASETPFILTYTYAPESKYPTVGFNNFDAAYRLTEYVIGLGHRRFGLIVVASSWNDRVAQRLRGIRAALADHAIALADKNVVEVPYSMIKGRSALRRLMSGTEPPTIVMAGNDLHAVSALLECQALGLSVPDQVSIVGFDDLELSAEIAPGLTTCHIPIHEMTDRVVDYLLNRIAGRSAPHAVEVASRIIIRGSTGRYVAKE